MQKRNHKTQTTRRVMIKLTEIYQEIPSPKVFTDAKTGKKYVRANISSINHKPVQVEIESGKIKMFSILRIKKWLGL